MEPAMDLPWLPEAPDWAGALRAAGAEPDPRAAWDALVALANRRRDATRTNGLDRALGRRFPEPPAHLPARPVRLAVLASSTVSHLLPAMRVGALARGLWLAIYEAPYGGYAAEIMDRSSGLHAFAPDEVLLLLDTPHLTQGLDGAPGGIEAVVARLADLWARAKGVLGCPIVQASLLPTALPLLGSAEHRHAASAAAGVTRLNAALRAAADAGGVDILALDDLAARDGIAAWHDPVWWLRAKQAVRPAAAPMFGEALARVLAARRGLSRKCLVLDLDNTLWGGVVGDDGLAGLVLGQGSAEGEAFLDLQAYAKALARRGIILAVVSKNDEANALEVFERHPEMLLRRGDIAAFVANWDDKARNLRRVAAHLNIGLDALVFVDDNPFERELVRAELPMVAVPDLPEDPALVPLRLAEAGYFEALSVTDDDRARGRQYAQNEARAAAQAEAADLPAYLASLDMRLLWRPFDEVGLARIVQLVNKTNQFNLTTRRTDAEEARALMADGRAVALQFRLLDRFGDNGMIGVIAARPDPREGDALVIDTWLMSCRVLGRGVEAAMLAVLVEAARSLGARRLVGLYRRSPKNGMVAEHYPRLGFAPLPSSDEEARFGLDLDAYEAETTPIRIERG